VRPERVAAGVEQELMHGRAVLHNCGINRRGEARVHVRVRVEEDPNCLHVVAHARLVQRGAPKIEHA
jgi:hypothetical protein